jgi:hypothetical protein
MWIAQCTSSIPNYNLVDFSIINLTARLIQTNYANIISFVIVCFINKKFSKNHLN